MRRTIAAVLAATLIALCGQHGFIANALANQSPQQAYCTPPNTIVNGAPVNAPPVMQNFGHAEVCGGQYGDVFSDGPMFDPTFGFSGSSFLFVIPANVWIAKGQRVYTQSLNETAPSSSTSYWWVDAASGAITSTGSNSPPTSTAVLIYTIVANSSGIASVTPAARAALLVYGATISNLTSGDCVQAGTDGLLTSASGACGTGGGVTSVTGSAPITSTGGTTPAIGVTLGSCLANVAGALAVSGAGCTPGPSPTPLPCPTAGANVTITGTAMPACTINSSGGGSGLLLFAPSVTPSPQVGGFADTGPNYVVPTPYPAASTPFIPNAFIVATGTANCENGNYVDWGTSGSSIRGVVGQLFSLACDNDRGDPFLVIGGHGNISTQGGFFSNFQGSGVDFSAAYTNGYEWAGASTSIDNCFLVGVGGATGAVSMTHSTGSGTCTLALGDVNSPFSALALDSNNKIEPANSLTQVDGEVTCSLSPATSCTATATVRSGAKCQGTYNGTDTTVTLADLMPIAVAVLSTTATFTLQTSTPLTGTLAANYWCP